MENKFTIKVANYKNSKSLFAKFIRFQQRYIQWLPMDNARFTHSEIVFCYNDDIEILNKIKEIESFWTKWKWREFYLDENLLFKKFKSNNLWFSSSEEDGWTRFKFIKDDKNNWTYNIIEVSKEEYLNVLDYCIWEDNNPYWWLSIFFTQALKTLWFVDKKSPFCAQIVTQALQKIWYLCWYNSIQINPGKLNYILEWNTLNEKPSFLLLFILIIIVFIIFLS